MSPALRALPLFSAAVMGVALFLPTAQAQPAKIARDADSQRSVEVLIAGDSPSRLMPRSASPPDMTIGSPHPTPTREKPFAAEA